MNGNVDDDVWDDTMLLKAYDDALNGVQPKKRKKITEQPPTTSVVQKSFNPDTKRIQKPTMSTTTNKTTNNDIKLMLPSKYESDSDLVKLLQAHYDAGYALGYYHASHSIHGRVHEEEDEEDLANETMNEEEVEEEDETEE